MAPERVSDIGGFYTIRGTARHGAKPGRWPTIEGSGGPMNDLSVRKNLAPHKLAHKVRFVTAASLFDGHDASINIMRRILQASGAEVIHLGHNRSVGEVV